MERCVERCLSRVRNDKTSPQIGTFSPVFFSIFTQNIFQDKMFSKTSNLMGTASIFRDQQAAKEAEKQRMMMRRASQQRRESIVPGPKANVRHFGIA